MKRPNSGSSSLLKVMGNFDGLLSHSTSFNVAEKGLIYSDTFDYFIFSSLNLKCQFRPSIAKGNIIKASYFQVKTKFKIDENCKYTMIIKPPPHK